MTKILWVGDQEVTSGALRFTAAATKIIPGATSFAVRNNADGDDNLKITDAGIITTRGAGPAGAAAGDIVLAFGKGYRSVDSAGTGTYRLIYATTGMGLGNEIAIDSGYLKIATIAAASIPAASAALNGLFTIDHTNHRLIFCEGALRYYAQGTAF